MSCFSLGVPMAGPNRILVCIALFACLSMVVTALPHSVTFNQPVNIHVRRDALCDGQSDGTACDDGNPNTRGYCSNETCIITCVGVTYEGECLSQCPGDMVSDAGRCVELHPECGDYCLECDEKQRKCARCTFDKYLEKGKCSDTCSIVGTDGSPSYYTETNPRGKYCNTRDGALDLSQTTIIGIAAAGGVLGLLIIGTCIFFCCCRPEEDDFATPAVVATMENGSYEMQSKGPSRSRPQSVYSTSGETTSVSKAEKEKWQRTVRRAANRSKALADAGYNVSAAVEHIIDTAPVVRLSPSEAQTFFSMLETMRDDQGLYAIMLRDMQARQQSRSFDRAAANRYDRLIADVARVLRLFGQEKGDTTVPAEGTQLLEWAKSTLDQYVSSKAAQKGVTTDASDM
eukprot:m.38336 g.38336  ORF g.38336 m.38336 type:complete len:401 (+) comp10187_c0_seq2:57-1259(+)